MNCEVLCCKKDETCHYEVLYIKMINTFIGEEPNNYAF
jgi:hypothetical protein